VLTLQLRTCLRNTRAATSSAVGNRIKISLFAKPARAFQSMRFPSDDRRIHPAIEPRVSPCAMVKTDSGYEFCPLPLAATITDTSSFVLLRSCVMPVPAGNANAGHGSTDEGRRSIQHRDDLQRQRRNRLAVIGWD